MTTYWCVNFDSEACLQHGIKKKLWMMQYQYADDHGNNFQDGKQRPATTANWRRLRGISEGDWFVAYLPRDRTVSGNSFFAVGQVRMPRISSKSGDRKKTIEEYVAERRSHDHNTGYVYYKEAPVFYEDFTDEWREPENDLARYAQRIDVEDWEHYVPEGIPWLNGLKIPVPEIQRAFFKIRKGVFDRIAKQLATKGGSPETDLGAGSVEGAGEAAVETPEKNHARNQGFLLDSKLRKALDDYAMEAAKKFFRSKGYNVEDRSKGNPYDLRCTKAKERLQVEVKGTQTDGHGIILTPGEIAFARRNKGKMALFVLHSIKVSSDGKVLRDGAKTVIWPWDVDEGCLKPISYMYGLPAD
jgi:hypothetical protein